MLENFDHIFKGCIAGDAISQRILYENFKGYLLKIVFRYVYHYDRAVDVVNDSFVKAIINIKKFNASNKVDSQREFMGWMRKIAINAAIDELRKSHMLPQIGSIPEYVLDIPDNCQQADQQLLYKELILLIKALPPAYRIVFNLYVIDGYSHSEISKILQIAIGTSKSNLSRARELLQKSLRKMEEEQLCSI